MNELMNILTKCFQVLYTKKNNLSWDTMYYNRHSETELLNRIVQLENMNETDRHEGSRLTYVSSE